VTATGETPATDVPATAATGAKPGLGDLIAIRAFRRLLIANILSAIAFGTSRFVFVWLVGELTDWNPATAILGIVIGLPPLLLSAWAGALADRLSPVRLATTLFAISAVGFAVSGVLVATDNMTVPLAVACGFVTSIAPSMLMPLMQAIVPTVTPPGRLMQAVALQNLSMMVSTMGGIFLGGAVMQLGGTEAGFWLVTIACILGGIASARDGLPTRLAGAATVTGSIRDGMRVAFGTEPLRSLLMLTTVFGIAIATSSLLLPEFARDVLGTESLAASALNVIMSIGMMITSMFIATRWHPSRPGMLLAVLTVFSLGGGLIAIGLSQTYVACAISGFAWGMCGGIAMTLMRTLTQGHTPPELMGRVMGLSMLAQNGAFPIAALGLFGLVAATDVADTMVIVGIVCCVLNLLIHLRPHIRQITATEAAHLPASPAAATSSPD
jgi:MFS family permease